MLIKQKGPYFPLNLALRAFGGLQVLSFAFDKAKLFAENFSQNSNPDNSGISLPVFLSRTNLKVHNISVTPKMAKNFIAKLIHQRHVVLVVFQLIF